MDYSELKPGQQLSLHKYLLSSEVVSKYIGAVGDESPLYSDGTLVPPTAVAALSLRSVIDDLSLPGGTIHAGQELEFKTVAKVGQELTCYTNLIQNSVRGNFRFLSVETRVEDETGSPIMRGKSTIIVPV